MGRILSIHSYRGGTGKSNVTANLAWLLARRGKRVAVLDTDLQSPGVHMVLGLDRERLTFTLTDFLFGNCEIEEAAYDLTRDLEVEGEGALFLLPSRMTVEAISRVIAQGYDAGRLGDHFDDLIAALGLDVLLLDTHPGLNRETMLSTSVSDLLLILLRPDVQDFHGTAVILKVAQALNVGRTLMLANKVSQSTALGSLRDSIQSTFGADLVGLLPLSDEMATLGSRGLFARRFPGHPISVELESVTTRLLAELER
ncbi:MAG: MinD/ParA family protein [Planctomycetota bacterium]